MSVTEKKKIIRTMTIDEIFATFPQKAQKLAQVLSKAGLQCVGCSASTWETLESGILKHGYDETHLEELLKNLNKVLDEESDVETITLTERAAKKYKEICEADEKAGWGLRFDEKPAGCSGFEYTLDFSEKAFSDDAIFVCHGVEIHVNKKVLGRLLGCEIDFVEGLQSGFKISNPNVRSSCGCGTSHGY